MTGTTQITGTDSPDVLHGTAGSDQIWGSDLGSHNAADNDTIYGHGGLDFLFGFDGDDYVSMEGTNGELGDLVQSSQLDGGAGNDTIIGSDGGIDYIYDGPGNDVVDAKGGADVIMMAPYGDYTNENGSDVIHAGDGNDLIYLHDKQFGGDTIYGDAGIDRLQIAPDNYAITLPIEQISIIPDGNGYILQAPDGRSIRVEGIEYIQQEKVHGIVSIYLGSGGLFDGTANAVDFNNLTLAQKDILASSTGDSIYASGGGNDYVTLPDLANATLGTNQAGQSIIWDFDRTFEAGTGDDTIVGGDFGDKIDGGDGNDHINGAGGGDTLFGGAGQDWLIASDGDEPNEFDRLDGGANRDTFYVNNGDVITQFELIDDHILFKTSQPVSRIAIVYDEFTNSTEIRAYAADLVTYEAITLEQGIRPNLLKASFFTGTEWSGVKIQNDFVKRSAFSFAMDAAAAEKAMIDSLTEALASVPRETLTIAIGELSAGAGKDAIERYVAAKVAAGMEADLAATLAKYDLGLKTIDAADGFAEVVLKYSKGQYDGKLNVMARDIGSIIADVAWTGGGLGFKLATEIAADLVGRLVFAMKDGLYVTYSQVKYGKTGVATDEDDVVVIDSDGAVFTLGDGSDLIINSRTGINAAGRTATASVEPRTIDGGTGIDTIVYAETTIVTVDLAAGTAKGAFGSDILTGIENVGGGSAADLIRGDGGTNELTGANGDDRLEGRAGDDRLDGGAGIDRLYGNEGADTLDGGASADVMYGGVGNDTYVADHLSDAVVELAGEGSDTVLASRAHTLKANVENLTQIGIYSIHGTGNALANVMTGNSGSNRLWGEAGNDTLIGNDGGDQLDGGAGSDAMTGGAGNDIYFVDNIGDTVSELIEDGRDTVRSTITYTLGSDVEWLEIQGSAHVNGTGNVLANVIKGNGGANMLAGLGGNDKLYAGGGNDILDGGEGGDWLEGGAGSDQFTGGSGSDRFVFREGDFGGASVATADVIHDFVRAEGDKIRLDLVDANSTLAGNQAFAFLGTGAFTNVAGQLRYEQSGGNTFVQGDLDGDGTADFTIQLDGTVNLVSGDFIL